MRWTPGSSDDVEDRRNESGEAASAPEAYIWAWAASSFCSS